MEPSKSDLVRQWIRAKLDSNYDYSLASNRRQDLEDFVKAHPELKTTTKNESDLHRKILKEMLKKETSKTEIQDARKTSRKPKPNQDMIADIIPEPQPEPTPEPQATQGTSSQTAQTTEIKKEWENFDEKGVAACFAALWSVPKYAYGDFLENLTDEEKQTLGRIWLPAFRKYLTENWAIVGVPIIVTAGMFAPKIAKARKLKKQQDKDKDKKKVEKLTCKFCNEIFPEKELEAHELACDKRK